MQRGDNCLEWSSGKMDGILALEDDEVEQYSPSGNIAKIFTPSLSGLHDHVTQSDPEQDSHLPGTIFTCEVAPDPNITSIELELRETSHSTHSIITITSVPSELLIHILSFINDSPENVVPLLHTYSEIRVQILHNPLFHSFIWSPMISERVSNLHLEITNSVHEKPVYRALEGKFDIISDTPEHISKHFELSCKLLKQHKLCQKWDRVNDSRFAIYMSILSLAAFIFCVSITICSVLLPFAFRFSMYSARKIILFCICALANINVVIVFLILIWFSDCSLPCICWRRRLKCPFGACCGVRRHSSSRLPWESLCCDLALLIMWMPITQASVTIRWLFLSESVLWSFCLIPAYCIWLLVHAHALWILLKTCRNFEALSESEKQQKIALDFVTGISAFFYCNLTLFLVLVVGSVDGFIDLSDWAPLTFMLLSWMSTLLACNVTGALIFTEIVSHRSPHDQHLFILFVADCVVFSVAFSLFFVGFTFIVYILYL